MKRFIILVLMAVLAGVGFGGILGNYGGSTLNPAPAIVRAASEMDIPVGYPTDELKSADYSQADITQTVFLDCDDYATWTSYGGTTNCVASDETAYFRSSTKSMRMTFQTGGVVTSAIVYKNAVNTADVSNKFITARIYIPESQRNNIASVALRVGDSGLGSISHLTNAVDQSTAEPTYTGVTSTGWTNSVPATGGMYVTCDFTTGGGGAVPSDGVYKVRSATSTVLTLDLAWNAEYDDDTVSVTGGYKYAYIWRDNCYEEEVGSAAYGWHTVTIKWEDMTSVGTPTSTPGVIAFRPAFVTGATGGSYVIADTVIVHDSPYKAQYLFRFDDNSGEQYEAGCYLWSKGLRGCFSVPKSNIGISGAMSVEELRSLQAMGHVIINHSLGADKFGETALSTTSLCRNAFYDCLKTLVNNGLIEGARIFCSPGGQWPSEALPLDKDMSAIWLTSNSGGYVNVHPWYYNDYLYSTRTMSNAAGDASAATLNGLVDSGITYGCPVAIVWHIMDLNDSDGFGTWVKFTTHVDYVAAKVKAGLIDCVTPLEISNVKLRKSDITSAGTVGTNVTPAGTVTVNINGTNYYLLTAAAADAP